MSVVTRSRSAARLRSIVHHLPDSMWLEILSNLPGKDIGRLNAVCSHFHGLVTDVWQVACAKRWPEWYAVSDAPAGCHWRRQYEMFELRENDLHVVISPPTINKLQTVVTAAHRTVLVEWLSEVCQNWDVDSTVHFKAITYLDHYLSCHNILRLSRFQLYGLGCLRAALLDTTGRHQPVQSVDKELDPQRFANLSNKSYSSEEVESATTDIQQVVPEHLRRAPSAKMFLRSFWYRLTAAKQVHSSKVHIYTLASFFLQLSLLDMSCCGFPACALAAAALSVALSFSDEESWPKLLQNYTALTSQGLQPIKVAICQAQATQAVEHFRLIWCKHEGEPGQKMYVDHHAQWQKIISLMSASSKMRLDDS